MHTFNRIESVQSLEELWLNPRPNSNPYLLVASPYQVAHAASCSDPSVLLLLLPGD